MNKKDILALGLFIAGSLSVLTVGVNAIERVERLEKEIIKLKEEKED